MLWRLLAVSLVMVVLWHCLQVRKAVPVPALFLITAVVCLTLLACILREFLLRCLSGATSCDIIGQTLPWNGEIAVPRAFLALLMRALMKTHLNLAVKVSLAITNI